LSSFSKSTGSTSSSGSTESVGMGDTTSSSEVQLVRTDQPGRVEELPAEITESDLPHRTGYEWGSSHVSHQFLKYRWSSMVESYVTNVTMLSELLKAVIIYPILDNT